MYGRTGVVIGLLAAAAVVVPSAVSASGGSAGTDIGNASPVTGTVTGAIVSGSDDWWVVYPATAGGTVGLTVTDTAASGSSCTSITANLDGTGGTNERVTNISLGPGGAGGLSGKASGSDRYYVEVTPAGCASVASYQITLTSGGGGTAPDPVASSVPAGTSIGNAWPPLQGHASYTSTLGSTASADWYVLYKKPDSNAATVRIEDTGTGCGLNAYLYDTNGTQDSAVQVAQPVDSNGSVTLTVPPRETGDPQGRYFLAISSNFCSGGGEPLLD